MAGSGLPSSAGFADGAAGIAWALRRYAGHRPERAAHAERTAVALLDSGAHHGDPADLSWSHGLAGRAVAGLPNPVGPPDDASLFEASVRLADAPIGPDLSLAQGVLGRLEALTVLAGQGDSTARSALRRHTGHVLALVEAQGHRCATPDHVLPGLLTGLAGIGYGLLRLAHPGTVPSVLLLHHPDH